jgi:two-component system NtrC family sensor kinase
MTHGRNLCPALRRSELAGEAHKRPITPTKPFGELLSTPSDPCTFRTEMARTIHDLRNDFTSSMVLADLIIKDEGGSTPSKSGLLKILASKSAKSLRRAQNLLDDVIILCSAGNPRREQIDLSVMLAEAMDDAKARSNETGASKPMTFSISAPECLPNLIGDPVAIHRIVSNLMNNALDAMPDGGTLQVAALEDPAGTIRISVQDDGIGMSPELIKDIFKPSFSTKGSSGNGLGLAIVEHVVSSLGGKVHVASELGVGTTFEIILPIDRSD